MGTIIWIVVWFACLFCIAWIGALVQVSHAMALIIGMCWGIFGVFFWFFWFSLSSGDHR